MTVLSAVFTIAAALSASAPTVYPDKPNEIAFPVQEARFVRLLIHQSVGGEPCIDELQLYGPEGKGNLALAKDGAKATASSCLPGYAIHQVKHLNDGQFGNGFSWIAAGTFGEWVQIELPQPTKVAKVVFSRDREGRFRDRIPTTIEVQVSDNSKDWKKVAMLEGVPEPGSQPPPAGPPLPPPPLSIGYPPGVSPDSSDELTRLRYFFVQEAYTAWLADRNADPIARAMDQMGAMLDRLAQKSLDVGAERQQLVDLHERQRQLAATAADPAALQELLFDVRLAKRRLMLRDPDLTALQKVLFVKRHPYEPSHNYSDILDSQFRPGGGICVVEIPQRDGRLEPAAAKVTMLFDGSAGIPRDPVADFAAEKIYFAFRPTGNRGEAYWHLMGMNADGSGLRQLTDGPFHDYYPCPLPDGDLAFISSRCRSRYLCWVPQSMVLFRMGPDGQNIRALSHANLSEWGPSVMSDGRIIWTRSEYLDKGANFGHTLWAIHPDGRHPELIYGNDTKNCLLNGREVPGTSEVCATLISHFGDFNGPIALVDTAKGRFNPAAAVSITPDVPYNFDRGWPTGRCFRDPFPLSRDYVLVSHSPLNHFGLFVIDRFGNREVLYFDPAIGSMAPTPLRATARPPVLGRDEALAAEEEMGEFVVANVYRGLPPSVDRRAVKYLRVCEEVQSRLETLPDGRYKEEYLAFQDYYAAPTHKLAGPYGWPSFVAKAVYGLAPIAADGSAHFRAPAGKVLYFQLLDQDYNEIQRMRSVVQLQPGEKRGCIGCHENRKLAPPLDRPALVARSQPSDLQPPPWGAGPFSYDRVVQPIWDAKCVSCHNQADTHKIDLTGLIDAERIPASYRTLIGQGWVHYFSLEWGLTHHVAEPMTFGTLKSRLWEALRSEAHKDVRLTTDEIHAIKCWTDLNCPLWSDYRFRLDRPGSVASLPR